MMRDGICSPPPVFYRPSPQAHHFFHPSHPEFNMPMYSVVPTPPGGIPGRQQNLPTPGAGGLYGLTDIPSPPGSFHMSMVDASTPTNMTNMSMMGGMPPPHLFKGGGVAADGVRDLNQYLPCHRIRLDDEPKRLFTVENNVTRETIVVLASNSVISLHMLKIKKDEENKVLEPSEKFEFVKFHSLSIEPHDLEAFVISQNCSITLTPFKLTYALSTRGGKTVFVYDQGKSNQIPEVLKLEDVSEDLEESNLAALKHDYSVTHIAIDAEKEFLAAIQELGTIIVWDIPTRSKIATFHIPYQPVHVSFHISEPYQLLVVDANGWARFFNVFRQCCFRSIHLIQSGVFSADWSISNPNIFAAGFAESFMIVDSSKPISSLNKCYEMPEQVVNAIKINPGDDKVFATLSRLTGTIQLWKDNFGTHIWRHRNAYVNDIAWVHGYPYLLALGYQTLYIYESSVS